jgi:hypothetical protein
MVELRRKALRTSHWQFSVMAWKFVGPLLITQLRATQPQPLKPSAPRVADGIIWFVT